MKSIEIRKFKQIHEQISTDKKQSVLADLLQKDFVLLSKPIKDSTKESFYHEIGILLSSGVDLKTALELFGQVTTKKREKLLFDGIRDRVVNGSTLSAAIQTTSGFTPYEFYSLQIGEETGKLSEALNLLSDFFGKKIKQNRQILHALSYPSIILVTSILAVSFMIQFVIPMFADVFKRFGGNLPYMTKLVLKISALPFGYIFLFFLVLIAIYLWLKKNHGPAVRKLTTQVIMKIPFVGPMVQKIYLARFSFAMSLLLEAKVPLLRAITLVKQMINYYPIEQALIKAELSIITGIHFHKSLEQHDIFPKKMISLIKVGEEINQLQTFFQKIAMQYTDEVEIQTGLLSSMIEPFIIVFLGVIIGVILIAMYLPMFQLSSTF